MRAGDNVPGSRSDSAIQCPVPLFTSMPKETTMKYVYSFFLFLLCNTSALAQQSCGTFLGEINNKHSSFVVRVNVDHADRVYVKDDLLRITVESSAAGYLYLFHRDAVGNVTMLFPNRLQKKNLVQKNEPVTVPAPGSIFQIRIDAPFGNELLKAVASQEPLEFFAEMDLTGINTLRIDDEDGKKLAKSVMSMKKTDWTEHHIDIRTVDSRNASTLTAVPHQMAKKSFLGRIILRPKDGRK